jgi:hypothetical protein
MARTDINVFIVESPIQVLNAEEARHFFNFTNNHLIIVLGGGFSVDSFKRMVRECNWDSVRFIMLRENRIELRSGWLGQVIYQMQRIRYNIRQYNNRKRFDRLASSLSNVQNLILGNYGETRKPHLCHFANTLKHEQLYLIDDGTDTILVNDERTGRAQAANSSEQRRNGSSPWHILKRQVRQAFLDWNKLGAKNVTFFTAYDLKVRQGDRLVRHDYPHLRKRLADSPQSSQILFLGQTMIEDDYLEPGIYFDYLRKVRSFFVGEDLIYVPHLRESADTVRYVRDNLGLKIERPDLPIECHIAWRGPRPRVLASFCCGALANCSVIFGQHLKIMAFYLSPESLLKEHEFIEDIYRDLRGRANESLQVVNL